MIGDLTALIDVPKCKSHHIFSVSEPHPSHKFLTFKHYNHSDPIPYEYAMRPWQETPPKPSNSLCSVNVSKALSVVISYTLCLCLRHVLDDFERPRKEGRNHTQATCCKKLTKF